jgi:hypothetical protein
MTTFIQIETNANYHHHHLPRSFLNDIALQLTERQTDIQMALFGVGRAGMRIALTDTVVYASMHPTISHLKV